MASGVELKGKEMINGKLLAIGDIRDKLYEFTNSTYNTSLTAFRQTQSIFGQNTQNLFQLLENYKSNASSSIG